MPRFPLPNFVAVVAGLASYLFARFAGMETETQWIVGGAAVIIGFQLTRIWRDHRDDRSE